MNTSHALSDTLLKLYTHFTNTSHTKDTLDRHFEHTLQTH